MPLSTSPTSGWSHTHCNAHSAAVRVLPSKPGAVGLLPHVEHLLRRPLGEHAAAHRLHDDDRRGRARRRRSSRACPGRRPRPCSCTGSGRSSTGRSPSRISWKTGYSSWNEKPNCPMRPSARGPLAPGEHAQVARPCPTSSCRGCAADRSRSCRSAAARAGRPGSDRSRRSCRFPRRQLRGQLHAFAVAVFERLAHPRLAVPLVVVVGGVDVVDTVVDGIAQHARRHGVVDATVVGAAVGALEHRQAHGAEAERRRPPVQPAEAAVLRSPASSPPKGPRRGPALAQTVSRRPTGHGGPRATRTFATGQRWPISGWMRQPLLAANILDTRPRVTPQARDAGECAGDVVVGAALVRRARPR